MKSDIISKEKTNLHPRNPHRFRYDFQSLILACEDLKPFVFINQYESETIDFTNQKAVKALNKAILKHHYDIDYWDIPENYLCPPIPGRADYIHYLADILRESTTSKQIMVLDVGLGANCVYPIIGSSAYGWHFVGSDVDPISIQSANAIINKNKTLLGKIECRLQPNSTQIFDGIIKPNDFFDLTMCNPPFHDSPEAAAAGNQRKVRNLKKKVSKEPNLNFGGQNAELWCEGGEAAFIKKMIEESVFYANQCGWFTTLVSKKETLPSIYHAIRWAKAAEIKTIEMAQGQKISRIVAWRF